ncbi:MAG TPA: Ig-like domain-containing protein [Gemmatimonadales bacterium]|nr:Ig-like domain-containing protein [Gemmatimonadales bacterium]
MRVAGRFLFGGFLALTAACGSDVTEPGALVITLNGPPPSLTTSTTLAISGQVTRTPPAPEQDIVVTVTGGTSPVSDTAAVDGSFAFNVGLTANAQNNLSVTASDLSGSSATPVTLAVRHDGTPPGISSMTPAHQSDEVTPAVVTVVFDEPVVPGSAAVTVRGTAGPVPGAVTVAPDSLGLTFTPTGAFAANIVHTVTVAAQDVAGNALTGASRCFATGGPGITVFTDPAGDIFAFSSPEPALVPPDVRELRVATDGTLLHVLLEFAAPRAISASAPNNLLTAIDFDMDQDGATGFITVKDTLYSGILPSSGLGAESAIFIEPQGSPADSSAAGLKAEPFAVTQFVRFLPVFCGNTVGLSVPRTALGDDDGQFDVVGLNLAVNTTATAGTLEDPMPDTGFYTVGLTAVSRTPVAGVTTSSVPRRGRVAFSLQGRR